MSRAFPSRLSITAIVDSSAMIAARTEALNCVKALLTHGADRTVKSREGKTAKDHGALKKQMQTLFHFVIFHRFK